MTTSDNSLKPSAGDNPFVGPRPLKDGETLYGRDTELQDLFYLLING